MAATTGEAITAATTVAGTTNRPAGRPGLTASIGPAFQIMVPLFIANGDIIRVDTAGKKYLGEETSGG
jgi:hypothetical protein